MTPIPPGDLRRTTRLAKKLLPADGSLDGLITNLSAHRRRPVTVVSTEIGLAGPSGLWLESEQADWIVVDSSTSPSQRAAVICHEVAHMLLGHDGLTAGTAVTQLVSTVRPSLAARFLMRHEYDAPTEHSAETLATQLVAEHVRRGAAARLNNNPVSQRLR